MTLLATWDAAGRSGSAAGVSGSPAAARARASAWMRANGGTSAVVEEVRLALGAGGLLTGYQRTGVVWRAVRRRDGRIFFVRRKAAM